jgi:nucleotide-binding universal stress UspA family protein
VILICFDGSADAQAALEKAAGLFPGQRATVLTVWESMTDVMARASLGWGFSSGVDAAELDPTAERAAEKTADEAAERGRELGLDAGPRVAQSHGTIAQTILLQADACAADVIVLGTRGLRGVRSLLLGSVSHTVVQHADRPVVVIPSQEVAAARRGQGTERA